MESEIDLLRQENARLMAKNYELETEIVKLSQIIEENARRDVRSTEDKIIDNCLLKQTLMSEVLPEITDVYDICQKQTQLKQCKPDSKTNNTVSKDCSFSQSEISRDKKNTQVSENSNNSLSSKLCNASSNFKCDEKNSEFSLEAILTGSNKVTSQVIVDLFNIAMKARQKEILCWYCYYKTYEDRVRDVKSKNGIDDKSARTLVYSEIKPLLPDITDINLPTNMDDIDYDDSIPNWNGHVTSKTNKTDASEMQVTTVPQPIYDYAYFHNKALDQYFNLYKEFSSENVDYYRITNKTLCPLCKLDHDNEENTLKDDLTIFLEI
ncbi:hypothetical protein C1645_812094 [Glomus cerebriforme]|uniref:Uncharacterized protein n=1 Tax=Glomus cerebriforme TaxID=658196 RepID=A0A397TVM7_9GLOM|nr:hypothetical protein C1645_812094 [Glomus cerebriforme]